MILAKKKKKKKEDEKKTVFKIWHDKIQWTKTNPSQIPRGGNKAEWL